MKQEKHLKNIYNHMQKPIKIINKVIDREMKQYRKLSRNTFLKKN